MRRVRSLRSLPSNDEIFAAAIRRSRVVLGKSVSDSRSDDAALEGSGYGVVTTKGAPDPRTFLVSFPGLVANIPILEKAAAGRGVFTEADERDGIVRRAPVVMHAGNAFVPSLALEMLRVATNSNSPVIRSDKNGIQGVNFSRFQASYRPTGPFMDLFQSHRSRALCVGERRLARPCP